MLLGAAAVVLLAQGAISNGCTAASSCTACLGGAVGATCGWCAVNTTTSTSVGPQCVDLHSTFDCNIQFQTDKCTQGWKCEHNSANNASQCVPSTGGIADKATCESSCKHPPPKPPPPPSPPKPHHAFTCNAANLTCTPSPFGDPSKTACEAHCKQSYTCDSAAKQCKPAAPNATGHHYYNKDECAKNCPLHPMPVPWEMRGLWRGFAIDHAYAPGEWVAEMTNASVAIWYPDGTGAYKVYAKGAASALGVAGKYVLVVHSTEGKLVGTEVRFLAADYSMDPEVAGFLQLAVDEKNVAQEVTSFDAAMSTATVLSFESCPGGGAPSPPTPPTPPPTPPPCKAKLDVVVVLDGSNSIKDNDWQHALTFVSSLVDGFKIAADQVEMGVVQFSEVAETVIDLSADAASIKAAVGSLRQMKENTNTYAGFEKAKSLLEQEGRAGTKGKLVLLLTDGRQNMGRPAELAADALKKEGAQIFGVGIGPHIDKSEIESWCSDPLASHYFSVSAFDQLEKILQKIIANACPHPPSAPLLELGANAGKNCKFHLPPGLPTTALATKAQERLHLEAQATQVEATELTTEADLLAAAQAAPSADKCNTYSSCSTCIGQHSAGDTCGWCTGDIHYAGSTAPSSFKCAGHGSASNASKFTCTGHFQTSTCAVPGDCGLKGVYRGLRIDNRYAFGEYQASFTSQNTSESVKLTTLDATGAAKATVTGTLKCDKKCADGKTDAGVPFTLTTAQGAILHGICGFTDQAQAETSGLMWALSDAGVGTAPTGFDAAMLNTSQAAVYTYYKCAEYKGGVCKFSAV